MSRGLAVSKWQALKINGNYRSDIRDMASAELEIAVVFQCDVGMRWFSPTDFKSAVSTVPPRGRCKRF
jgi:hypothetical protein